MSLPPLANLFAVREPDPLALEALAADLATSGEFAEVWRPAPGWVAAAAPLPYGPTDGDTAWPHGLAFAEGRDVVGRPFVEVAELADRAPERLAVLQGDFGFIRFRSDEGVTVVRSCGGLVPFYLWHSGERSAVATRLGNFVRYLPNEPQLDPLVNAVWTTGHGFFPDGRTFLTEVSILNRGCFARVEPGHAVTTGRYWSPRPAKLKRPTAARAREHAERLRALLIQKLERDLDPEGGNLLTLSGGVDSSSLAALASGVVGRKVWTWSLLPAPDDLYQHEMSYIEPLAQRFGFERRWEVRLEAETRLELLSKGPRVVFHVIHPALCDLPRVLAEAPVRVLFGGEFADEVCGSAHTWPDWATHARPTTPRDALRWAKRRLRSALRGPTLPFPPELPDFIRAEVREEYHEWLQRRRQAAAGDRAPLRYLALRNELDGFVAMNWEAASALGVRRSFPFFNREVLELAYACHPAELVGPGTKKLERTALRNDVPRRNLQRPDRGHWGADLNDARMPWNEPLPEALESIVREDWYLEPPRLVGPWDAHGLTQLLVLVQSLRVQTLVD